MTALDRLRENLPLATPGPWTADNVTLRAGTIWDNKDNDIARAWNQSDTRLIADARNLIEYLPRLVATLNEGIQSTSASGGWFCRWCGCVGSEPSDHGYGCPMTVVAEIEAVP